MLHTSIHLSNPYVLIYMRYSSRWIYLATNRSLPLHESQWSVNVLDIPGRLQLATKLVLIYNYYFRTQSTLLSISSKSASETADGGGDMYLAVSRY